MFVIPSIICAYICAYPILWAIFFKIFDSDLGSGGITFVPTGIATLEAIAVGFLIPTLSAIVPIQRALAKTLSDSLNTARATLSGTVIIVEDSAVRVVPYIMFGLLSVLMGVIIYIALPQALLH